MTFLDYLNGRSKASAFEALALSYLWQKPFEFSKLTKEFFPETIGRINLIEINNFDLYELFHRESDWSCVLRSTNRFFEFFSQKCECNNISINIIWVKNLLDVEFCLFVRPCNDFIPIYNNLIISHTLKS